MAGSDSSGVDRALQMYFTWGYYQMPPIVADSAVDRMRKCFEVTQGAGWHATFVFVYDEFWRAFRGSQLLRFLTGALGENFGQLPYIWGHFVPANSRGWRPHVDGPSNLKKLTVWLALNDATLENGCMYVVPRNAETEKISDQFLTIESIDREEAMKLLQNVKALPAPSGSYLGWGPYLIHWGSASGPLAAGRISISAEFAARPSNSLADAPTLLDLRPDAPLPSFSTRLRLIAHALQNYEAFDPRVLRSLPLADKIISHIITAERTS